MVCLDCEELKQGLARKAKTFAQILLQKLITNHREHNLQWVTSFLFIVPLWRCCPFSLLDTHILILCAQCNLTFLVLFLLPPQRICQKFEIIKEKALNVPENTEDMTEMNAYINLTKTQGIAELNEKIMVGNSVTRSTCNLSLYGLYGFLRYRINTNTINYHHVLWQEAHHRLSYLLDVHIFEPEDMELNSAVLLWPQNILPVFELNDEVTSFIPFTVELADFSNKDEIILDKCDSLCRWWRRPRREGSRSCWADGRGWWWSWRN